MKRVLFLVSVIASLLAACAPSEPATLTVMTHDSFEVSQAVIQQFEQETGIQVQFIKAGDTGAALNRAILSKNAPIADVFYGVDNTFLSRALEADIFEAYDSPLLTEIPEVFQLDPSRRALPVDYGDVCINYDASFFKGKRLPESLADLILPEFKGMLVVQNPALSSPGLAFLLATVVEFGEEGYLDYWRKLVENGVVVVNDWETAYYTNFSGSSGKGAQPLVVSYNSSPAAEMVFAASPLAEPPTGSLTAPGMCFRQVEFVGILKGTRQRATAEKFIDFMLSQPFQEDMPLQMFVFPVHPRAALPVEFQQYVIIPDQPATLSPEVIAAGRESWIEAWREVVLK